MAFQRRRRPERRVVPAVPAAAAISGGALLIIAVLACHCLLAPSPLLNGAAPTRPGPPATASQKWKRSPVTDLWGSKRSEDYCGCSNASSGFATAEANTLPNRYLMIATSGGLNQQRTGIIDGLVAARILNATLVVPILDQDSFWNDASDGDYCALLQVVRLTKFDYRLSNKLDIDLQKLRCRVNYQGLKFTDQIQVMGDTLIKRMKARSKHFIALHLRFEPDMLAFSGCYYGGGEKERTELGAIRKRWKNLHASNPEKGHRHGKCPLTPEEVGLLLRALGFGNDVHLYVASGEIYGGEETLSPLKALFPNFHSKETLATKEELAPFSSYSSRMAALDFIVCDGSDVFVTNNNGNMARMLAGRRRYFGHKRTIRPNAKKLYSLFLNRTSMPWEIFSSRTAPFKEDSWESLMRSDQAETNLGNGNLKSNVSQSAGETIDNHSSYEDFDWIELDDGENTPIRRSTSSGMESENLQRSCLQYIILSLGELEFKILQQKVQKQQDLYTA
ncbi:GDP-fucose protein O-fucosyltransferase [Musa troglodytarum]|uniref:O-fucosyltransferase family protein n=1 Tax=Musa troglodytarum TaxID=320322 RepID=A0A9E7L068_9LILI|nr:GDP-fucose protein O-fucosyltransferase [Musa troglodytarum]